VIDLRIKRALLWFSLTVLFPMAVAAQQAAPQTKDDAISGRVLTDSGQPLPGVTVSLLTIGSRGAGVTTTDNEGRFKLQGLDGGIYRIVLRAPGYVTQIPDVASPAFRPGDNAELTLIKGGVIAGNIINFAGEPLVNIAVRAYQVRDADGNKVARQPFAQTRVTDDRGYYRLYGLSPGTYTVAAGGQGPYLPLVNPYANDAMTYAPASTRDTAAEIVVRSNQEVTADIRYRGEPGHAVSGKVSGPMPPFPFNPGVRLSDVESHFVVTTVSVNSPDRTFQMNGVTDGDYDIDAIAGGGQQTDLLASAPRRITVKGADVTGLDLTLATMGAIDSRVSFETDQKLNCGRRRDTALRETLITLRRGRPEDKSGAAKDKPVEVSDTLFPSASESIPNDKGEVHFRSLPPGNYHFEVRLPAAGWYLKDLTLGRPEPNIARNGISIKQGEKISSVTITIAEGGASLRGRVTSTAAPPNLRLYLAPAERENSDNPLHFFEAPVAGDGTFVVGNIAPGRYFLVAEAAEPAGPDSLKTTRTDAGWRAKILRDATTLNKDIIFKPCERTVDYEFRSPASKP
jgi:protocatechuate 3,4-dioxygenase beta subunit